MNSKLLHNSIWALKHLVLNAPNSLKMNCLDELGPGWLKQIINNGAEDRRVVHDNFTSSSNLGMGTSNAAGMQVDLLNAIDSDSTTIPSSQIEEDDGDVHMSDSEPETQSTRPKRTPQPPSSRAGSLNPYLGCSPDADDLAIQKEGLEFIRNLICGQGATEMIDFIFSELSQDRFFDMLLSKIKLSAQACTRVRRNQISELTVSVLYILTHIAAGLPRHRQILISQTELLKNVELFFAHEKREIRVCCAWLCINLTWVDDASDTPNCKARARELLKLGIFERLKFMENDSELDVRERTKTALHQMTNMLR